MLSLNSISDISALSGLTRLTHLYIKGNPLSYPSLTTHIPSFQSRGVRVIYDPRTLTSLVKISGDDQTGTAGSRLSDPFIVEVRDTNDVAFAGVPVAFFGHGGRWGAQYHNRYHRRQWARFDKVDAGCCGRRYGCGGYRRLEH